MARRPFYGQSDTKIAKMDMQAATAPGRAYAQGLSKLGESIGEGIKKFSQNKKDGEAAEMKIGAILEGMSDERKEELMSGESELSKSLNLFMEGELSNSKKKALLGGLVTMDARDRMDRQEELGNTLKQLQASMFTSNLAANAMAADQLEEQKQETEDFNQFLTQPGPSQMDPSGPDKNSVLRNMRAGKGATPPARMVPGPSSAEQMLVSPEAKSFMKRAIQQGAPVQQSMMMASQIDAAKQPKPLSPLQVYEGKKIIDKTYEPAPQKDMSGPTIVNDSVGIAMDLIGPFTTGYGSFLKAIPETDAMALDKTLETIKANIGFDKLQAMREASPTGGALGQVSNQELSSLQSVFGSLDQSQSDEDLKYNLQRLQHIYNNIIHGVGNHPYQMPNRGGTTQSSAGPTTATRGEDGVIRFK